MQITELTEGQYKLFLDSSCNQWCLMGEGLDLHFENDSDLEKVGNMLLTAASIKDLNLSES